LQSFFVWFIGFSISVGRLLLGNRSAVTTILWAEDGLFPLCIRNNGLIACLIEPYGGSMHFLPKLLAGILAPMPITVWPTLANMVAATLAGSISGMVYFLVRKSAHAASLALALAMIPVAHSSLRMEAINSYANAYIPVAYLFCVVYLVRPIMGLINRLALCPIYIRGSPHGALSCTTDTAVNACISRLRSEIVEVDCFDNLSITGNPDSTSSDYAGIK